MSRLMQAMIRVVLRMFAPGVAADLRAEGQLSFTDAPRNGDVDSSSFLDIEDNGADTTLITFAGMAVLYAAMPKFEFKKILQSAGKPFNFVFVRDIYRSSYRLAPDGSDAGLAFYERAVRDALDRIGARYNIAIGMSGGGEAAFRISGATPIHHIVAFNPAFPLERYSALRNVFGVLLDARKLLFRPRAYAEVLFVTLGTRFLWKHNHRTIGRENPDLPLRDYLRRAAPATLYYSRDCLPDARQALTLKDIPSITLIPVESPRHNCLADLKKRGNAAVFIQDAIQQGLSGLSRNTGNEAQ